MGTTYCRKAIVLLYRMVKRESVRGHLFDIKDTLWSRNFSYTREATTVDEKMFDSDVLRRQSCIKHPLRTRFRLTPPSMKLHDTRFVFRGGGPKFCLAVLAIVVILGSQIRPSNAFVETEVTPAQQPDTIFVDSELMNDLNDWLGKLNRKVSTV